MFELIGKDFIYSRVLLRCVLAGSLCTGSMLELEAGCGSSHGEGFHIHSGVVTLCMCWFTVFAQSA